MNLSFRLILAVTVSLALTGCNKPAAPAKPAARDMPDLGGTKVVEKETDGVGPTRNAAILDALSLAVKETNGGAVNALSVNGANPPPGGKTDAVLTNEVVTAASRGVVQSFEIVSEQQQGSTWRVKVRSKLNAFNASPADQLPKVVILPSKTHDATYVIGDQQLSSDEAGDLISTVLGDAIGRSNRFAVIDRKRADDTAAELSQLDDPNTRPAELAKLGQKLTADIVIIPEITRLEYKKSSRKLHFTGRELRSYQGGVDINFQVINVASGRTLLTKRVSTPFPDTPPTVYGTQKVGVASVKQQLSDLSDGFTRDFILKNFPISVVKLDGRNAILSQGEPMLKVGGVYQAVLLGEDVKDPQTGQSLGRLETNIGTITVSKTTDKMAFGTLSGSFDASKFQPGVIELRDQVNNAPPPAPATQPSASAAPAATPAAAPAKAKAKASGASKPKSTDGFEDF